jgi:cytoskeletal protein CcmA (bactofilin family)
MFGKNEDLDNHKMETIIGADTFFQGHIRLKGFARVDGKLEGSLTAEGVIVGPQGQIQGDITAKRVLISGQVIGNIHAEEILELQGQVTGNIQTARLSVTPGALLDGQCLMSPPKKPEAQS